MGTTIIKADHSRKVTCKRSGSKYVIGFSFPLFQTPFSLHLFSVFALFPIFNALLI